MQLQRLLCCSAISHFWHLYGPGIWGLPCGRAGRCASQYRLVPVRERTLTSMVLGTAPSGCHPDSGRSGPSLRAARGECCCPREYGTQSRESFSFGGHSGGQHMVGLAVQDNECCVSVGAVLPVACTLN
jgi:hypothetical protein